MRTYFHILHVFHTEFHPVWYRLTFCYFNPLLHYLSMHLRIHIPYIIVVEFIANGNVPVLTATTSTLYNLANYSFEMSVKLL